VTRQPRIVAFLCNWCAYQAADRAGQARLELPHTLLAVRVMCTGRVEPAFVLQAFREGADGVLVAGCHPGDCHYLNGNMKTLRRIPLLRRMLVQLGIPAERMRLEWVSASEGERYRTIVNEFIGDIRRLGPLDLEARRRVA
jgi:coenzyme F420-reducing hydrogenase delta subunit